MSKWKQKTYDITAGNNKFSFLESGDIYQATAGETMINQLISNPVDGSLNNIYLRIYHEDQINAYPLLGVKSESTVTFYKDHICWEGKVEEISYEITFYLTDEGIWFWDIDVKGSDQKIDIIYAQDIGLAGEGALRNNEAYISQYVDYKVFETEEVGYVVCARQNQPQSVGHPYLQQGSFTKIQSYSTDGYQFFGKNYRETNTPEILTEKHLANEVYQYEFGYVALQTVVKELKGEERFIFYGLFKENHEKAVTTLEFQEEIKEAWEKVKQQEKSLEVMHQSAPFAAKTSYLQTKELSMEKIEELFPNRHQEEWHDGQLLSFFTDTHEHVVLKAKELLVERPHGHILMSGNNAEIREDTITSTTWMNGVFHSHIVIGNTNFNKFLTNTRNPLNILKTSGQRIYVEIDGVYQLLTIPSVYEIGFNYTRWYYGTEKETFIITSYTVLDAPEVHLHVRTKSGKGYRFLVTNQIAMHTNEYEVPYHIDVQDQTMTVTGDDESSSADIYPDLTYQMTVKGAKASYVDEGKLMKGIQPGSASVAVFELDPAAEWSIVFQGSLDGKFSDLPERKIEDEIKRYRKFYQDLMRGFQLSVNGELTERLNKVNALSWWYTHNMLVHFSVPHGLEQYSGAAWGTRDVCQGPVEYFMATQNYEPVREIIKTVYSHQFADDGNWPQWFMFDRYAHVKADESHGDIIVWPLKLVADYLEKTKDFSLLEESVPYALRQGKVPFTNDKETIYEHIQKQLDYIHANFIHDTFLSSYGDGDWDDTLQPANESLRKYMVSTWTVALTYQAVTKFSKVLKDYDADEAKKMATLAENIKEDFRKYMLKTDVLPGFLYMEQKDQPEYMLHPTDERTGIQYRLLPMQRGIISELLTPEEAKAHDKIIKEQFYHADGIRLMDRPANYKGGVSEHFQRAEQGANFGREIGLLYVHAHIRYVEAMAKLGQKDEVWQGLEKINPIRLQDVVPNAEMRQSNAYFSSSDGKFNTRYEASENFEKLRDGSVPVKGGWRIYSSGPGIYLNQLISHSLGIRPDAEGLVIDPVLPDSLDQLTFRFRLYDQDIRFIYHLGASERKIKINGVEIETLIDEENPYRQGGVKISNDDLQKHLHGKENMIHIYWS